ncbi:MAG: PE family protein, partial [Candidatus Competibacter sp.]|nr:PE family protein [Candidatus Competibacter sp.]
MTGGTGFTGGGIFPRDATAGWASGCTGAICRGLTGLGGAVDLAIVDGFGAGRATTAGFAGADRAGRVTIAGSGRAGGAGDGAVAGWGTAGGAGVAAGGGDTGGVSDRG